MNAEEVSGNNQRIMYAQRESKYTAFEKNELFRLGGGMVYDQPDNIAARTPYGQRSSGDYLR